MFNHYALVDPRMPLGPSRIFYVGRTALELEARLLLHIKDAKKGVKAPVYVWIRSLLLEGVEPDLVELGWGSNSKEQKLIDKYLLLGSPLTNRRKGGW